MLLAELRVPAPPSLVFLVYVFAFLPWAAARTAQRLRAVRASGAGGPAVTREAVWKGVLLNQVVLLVLAWFTGRSFGYDFFALPPLGVDDLLATAGAMAAFFALRFVARAVRTEEERRAMTVFRLAPRSSRELATWHAVVVVASVAEEAAYRGVALAILWYSLGNPWIAACLCAVAFALAHWAQGAKSMLVIFAMGLVLHGLYALTGTLVLPVLVHAASDFIAGRRIRRDARRYDEERASLEPPASPA